MKKHVKIYFKENNIDPAYPVRCEIPRCCEAAVDICHIEPRGSGGGDSNENLLAMCRGHHNLAEAGEIPKEPLFELARRRIENGCHYADYAVDCYYQENEIVLDEFDCLDRVG